MPSKLESLQHRLADVNALHAAVAMMEWDQQTFMPKGGGAARAQHVGLLSRMAHEALVADETQKLAKEAAKEVEGGTVSEAMVRVTQRDIDLATKIPASLVEEKARLSAEAHEAWVEARANADFPKFQPMLERMVEIVKQEAEHLGYKAHIYDALIDQYEEGASEADCRAMFDTLKGPTVELVREIKERGKRTDDSLLYGEWDEELQKHVTEQLVRSVGFDLERGRQDTAAHPFCTGWSVGDIRLTTRFKPYLGSAIFGSLHEAGHGMYEQGSPAEWDLTPLQGGVSLGIHESQSRLWENIIGRSRPFWKRFLPDIQATFPQISGMALENFYFAINQVEPSYIRVEADEVTYNLHVLLRFEIECDLLTGKLAVQDLPDAWNAKMEELFGITPPSNREGCLQDVHWSGGSIGYFPTYTMGNLLSYQIWNTLKKDIDDTDGLISSGNFAPILSWLQEKIYSQGRRYRPKDLVMRVTGKPMGAEDYLEGLRTKYQEVYAL